MRQYPSIIHCHQSSLKFHFISLLLCYAALSCGPAHTTSSSLASTQENLTPSKLCDNQTTQVIEHKDKKSEKEVYVLSWQEEDNFHCLTTLKEHQHSSKNSDILFYAEQDNTSTSHRLMGSVVTGISFIGGVSTLPTTITSTGSTLWQNILNKELRWILSRAQKNAQKVVLSLASLGAIGGYVYLKDRQPGLFSQDPRELSSTLAHSRNPQTISLKQPLKTRQNDNFLSPRRDPSNPAVGFISDDDRSAYKAFRSKLDASFLNEEIINENVHEDELLKYNEGRQQVKYLEKELYALSLHALHHHLENIAFFDEDLLSLKDISYLSAQDLKLFLNTLSLQEFDYSFSERLSITILKHIFLDRIMGLRNTSVREILAAYNLTTDTQELQLYKTSEEALKKRFSNFTKSLLILKGHTLGYQTPLKYLYSSFDNVIEVANILKTINHPLTTYISGKKASIHDLDFDLYKAFFHALSNREFVKRHFKSLKIALHIDKYQQDKLLHNIFLSSVFRLQDISSRKLLSKYDIVYAGFLVPSLDRQLRKELKQFKTNHYLKGLIIKANSKN
ncbi:MAG: hypothetical protein OXC44_00150 [Proteobacteria bacterium]|nr:hypothetical protein [Pseudomonadota bacterium]